MQCELQDESALFVFQKKRKNILSVSKKILLLQTDNSIINYVQF